MRISFFLSLFVGLFLVCNTVGQTTTDQAETRARQLLDVISRGSYNDTAALVDSGISDRMRARAPKEQLINTVLSTHEMSRGFDVVGRESSTSNAVTLLVKNRLTDEIQAMYIAVEADKPYKIDAISFREPSSPFSTAGSKMDDRSIAADMSAFMKRLAEADVFSGTVLLARDGKVVFDGAYGSANKDFGVANRIDTRFNLGSMNKMFTAISIAQLVENGKISFDDPLSKFISDFPDAESAKKIKIKHLLSHTAGLGGYFSKRWADTSRANLTTVDEMMALAKQDENLLFEPGTKWRYSNTGMLVLGKIIEIVSGQSYYDYVRENIYKPAGMTNTDCYELNKVNSNLAVGYDKQFTQDGITWQNNIFDHVMRGGPQGGGYSTVEDLLKFDVALRSGKLVSPATLKLMTTPKPELNSPNYGYGFEVSPQTAGHSGGFSGISSDLTMYLNSGWTAIVMSNYSRAAAPVQKKMEALIGHQVRGDQQSAATK